MANQTLLVAAKCGDIEKLQASLRLGADVAHRDGCA
jgi:hypothetical protein